MYKLALICIYKLNPLLPLQPLAIHSLLPFPLMNKLFLSPFPFHLFVFLFHGFPLCHPLPLKLVPPLRFATSTLLIRCFFLSLFLSSSSSTATTSFPAAAASSSSFFFSSSSATNHPLPPSPSLRAPFPPYPPP